MTLISSLDINPKAASSTSANDYRVIFLPILIYTKNKEGVSIEIELFLKKIHNLDLMKNNDTSSYYIQILNNDYFV